MSNDAAVNSIFGGHRPVVRGVKRSTSDTSQDSASTLFKLAPVTTPPPLKLPPTPDELRRAIPPWFEGRSAKRKRPGHGIEPVPHQVEESAFKTPAKVLQPALLLANSTGAKRSLSGSDIPVVKRSHKKRRRLQDSLGPLRSYDIRELRDTTGPLSPLFFSNSPQLRPDLPPRYSSSEAAAKMLSKTQGEDSNVKTVTLTRGSYISGSPPTSNRHARHRGSSERISISRNQSAEAVEKTERLQLLGQVGVTELLEQDDRPTFIVDLADPANHKEGALEIIFANSALSSCGAVIDAIQGKALDIGLNPLVPRSFQQFREWILSASVNGEFFGGSPPAFMQGSMSWACSTLRKRFRIVSGTLLVDESRRTSTSLGPSAITIPSDAMNTASPRTRRFSDGVDPKDPIVLLRYQEDQDYFGTANPVDHSKSATGKSERHEMESILSPQTLPHPGGSVASISGEQQPPQARSFLRSADSSYESILSAASAANFDPFDSGIHPTEDVGFFDWTRIPDVESLPPHIQFARSIDWASTSLGPIEHWSADLRQMANLVMASPHPAAMYWGEDLVAIYNEAYVYLAGKKHPNLMGERYCDAWAEIWDDVEEVFASAMSTGQATMKDDDCLFIKRSDVLEETYFSWSIIPMVGGDGTVMGLYNPAFEKTRRKIAERRMLTLREVGEKTATARDVRGFWASVLEALECNEYDTPFVLLYSLAEDDNSEEASVTDSSMSATGIRQCFLEGSLGVPAGHVAAPETMDLRAGSEGFAPLFREVMLNGQTLVLEIGQGELPSNLVEGLDWRGFGDASRSIVICPIHPTTGENTLGFLVMGVNPRRPFDDDYNLFIQLLSRQLATSLASVVLFEEEIKRGQRAAKLAAMDRIELSEQLAARTQEAIESETKFTRMAEFAPVGMFIANSEGQITYCNDMWYEITRVPRSIEEAENWVDFVVEKDLPLVQQMWRDLVDLTKAVSSEFRFKAPWMDQSGARAETWVLFSAYPETHDDGTLKSVFGSITNISSQKWAEGLQKKKTEEAIELKRQQENFIDITSHEMRNPLSAILQCADEIITSLTEAKEQKNYEMDPSIYDGNIDAAQTITLCAQHQKRIVDDVLTMSKLDSALLMVTPIDVQPLTIVHRALKMFESELHSSDIDMDFRIDESFEKLAVDWVRIDPSRVMQVLINLTTNAIKFTTTEKKRTISVSISASKEYPSTDPENPMKYVPRRVIRTDMTQGPDWGTGEELYILFSVQDTGRGLSEEEKKSLFLRFSQASPRTHVQYGGSGLGLFISRELTELQGGEIGVASTAGQGSTFAFFVKARRSSAPDNPTEQLPFSIGARRASDGKGAKGKGAAATKVRDFAATNMPKERLKVLLVEDNLVNQRVLQKQLKKLECEVRVANHGREALDHLQNSRFWVGKSNEPDAMDVRVVLMDQEMPLMDGTTCTKRIRELEKEGTIIRHVPIIGITANARQEQIQQLFEAGMDDVVSKPFRIQEIVPKIAEMTARYRPAEELHLTYKGIP